MRKKKMNRASLQTLVARLTAQARNALTLLPGERPEWIVVDVAGRYPTRKRRPFFIDLPPELVPREVSLEDFVDTCEALASAKWLRGVVFRVDGLATSLATAFAVRNAIAKLGQR